MKKKLIALILVTACSFSLVACQGNNTTVAEPESEAETDVETEVSAQEPEEVVEEINMEGVNMIENGDFHEGTKGWATFFSKGGVADFYEEDGMGVVDIQSSGNEDYSVQLYYDGFKLEMGGVYEFSLDMDPSIARNVEPRLQINGGDYHAYIGEHIDIEPGMKTYNWTFTMEEGTDPAPRLCLNFGTPAGGEVYEKHTIKYDNVSVKLVDGSNIVNVEVEDRSSNVNVNQVGYLTNARKTAVVRSEIEDKSYSILDESGNVVYTGTLSEAVDAMQALETVYQADFSDFTTPGTYTLSVSNGDTSYPFTIGDDVYDELLKSTFLMLYSQRCSVETDKAIVGEFAHGECHMGDALVWGTDNEYVEVKGGWHDAGDYGRYVVSGAQSVQDLFLTYEDYPEIWSSDAMGIPESGNGIPDILDEARFELDWMLKMQNKEGGVYHKVTCLEFPGFVMPEEETEQLYLAPVSTAATGDFAAVMAKASVIYKDIDPEFASTALEAAKKAWAYLETVDLSISFKNPEAILTGEYPDGQDKDERYWACIELAAATGDASYLDYAHSLLEKYVIHGFGWADMGTFGNEAYLNLPVEMQNADYAAKIKEEVTKKADQYLENSITDGYMVSLGDRYVWGSNLVVCNDARQMLFAGKIAGSDKYDKAAYDQVTYILGQNACSYCFVTGFGTVNSVHPHHRVSIVKGKPVPGMVNGGPDSALEDPFVKSTMADVAPAKCYADNEQSYSTNEVTIYWNTPFVYLLTSQMAK